MTIVETPSDEMERSSSMSLIEPISCSMTCVTVDSMSPGLAPG
jgi:hypothetical protein